MINDNNDDNKQSVLYPQWTVYWYRLPVCHYIHFLFLPVALPPVLVPNGYQHQQQGIPSLNMLSYEDTLPENRTLSDELGPSFGSRRGKLVHLIKWGCHDANMHHFLDPHADH